MKIIEIHPCFRRHDNKGGIFYKNPPDVLRIQGFRVTQVWQIDDFWVTFEKIAPSLWGAIFPKVTQGFEICATVTPPLGGRFS